jgi:hypothetical protein
MQKELPCESDHCTVVTVLRATSVIITSTDANGYEHQQGGPVQRLTISIDAQTYHPESYDGGVGLGVGEIGTLDLICWHNCFDLETGSRHFMGHGHVFYVTNEATMSGFSVPYVSIGRAQWQILEQCGRLDTNHCEVVSTLDERLR